MNTKSIDVREIHFAYPRGKAVFSGFSQTFLHNTIYGVIGKKGAGKTTLGKLMVGLLSYNRGEIQMNGRAVHTLTLGEIGASVGYLYQNPTRQLFATTVYEELSFVFLLNGEDEKIVHEKVMQQLEKFHLTHVKDMFPFYLSQGEKQRLVIASLLMRKLNFLILDEPTTALDVKRKKELLTTLKEIQSADKMGLIIISHDREFLENIGATTVEVGEFGD